MLGYILLKIGGGRATTKDKIDSSCGLYIYKQVNEYVEKNEPLIKIFGSNSNKIEHIKKSIENVIFIDKTILNKQKRIIYE